MRGGNLVRLMYAFIINIHTNFFFIRKALNVTFIFWILFYYNMKNSLNLELKYCRIF